MSLAFSITIMFKLKHSFNPLKQEIVLVKQRFNYKPLDYLTIILKIKGGFLY